MACQLPPAFFLSPSPNSAPPRSRGRSRSYLIPVGLQPFLPQKWPQLDSSGGSVVVSRGAGPCLLSGVQWSGWGQPASPPPRCCEWAWRPWLPSAPSCRSLRDSQGQLRPQARASVPVRAKQVAAASPHAPPGAKGRLCRAASSRQRRGPLGVRPGSRPCVGGGAVSISGAPLGAPGTSAESVKVTVARGVQAGNLSFLGNRAGPAKVGVVRASAGAPQQAQSPALALTDVSWTDRHLDQY